VLSSNRILFKNDALYFLSSSSVIIDTIPFLKFLFRLILCSVCTVTLWEVSWFKIVSLFTSKLTSCDALLFNVMPLNLQSVFFD